MTGNVRQTAQERVCGPIRAGHEQDTASDGTGPQNAPEGTGVANEWVVELYAEHKGVRCERVVRCRNCRALDQNDIDWRGWCYCHNFREYVEPSGFCAWGIDKED